MLSIRVVLVVLLCAACVSLWASGAEATTAYFYATGNSNGYVWTHRITDCDDIRRDPVGDAGGPEYELRLGFEYFGVTETNSIWRSFIHFETDGLPEDAAVTAAEIRLCVWGGPYGTGADSIYVLGGLQSDELDEEDYNNFVGWHGRGGAWDGPIVGRYAWSEIGEEGTYITITLSSASYSWIEAGDPKGAIVMDADFYDDPPGPGPSTYARVTFYGAYGNTAYDARLKVEYSQ